MPPGRTSPSPGAALSAYPAFWYRAPDAVINGSAGLSQLWTPPSGVAWVAMRITDGGWGCSYNIPTYRTPKFYPAPQRLCPSVWESGSCIFDFCCNGVLGEAIAGINGAVKTGIVPVSVGPQEIFIGAAGRNSWPPRENELSCMSSDRCDGTFNGHGGFPPTATLFRHGAHFESSVPYGWRNLSGPVNSSFGAGGGCSGDVVPGIGGVEVWYLRADELPEPPSASGTPSVTPSASATPWSPSPSATPAYAQFWNRPPSMVVQNSAQFLAPPGDSTWLAFRLTDGGGGCRANAWPFYEPVIISWGVTEEDCPTYWMGDWGVLLRWLSV